MHVGLSEVKLKVCEILDLPHCGPGGNLVFVPDVDLCYYVSQLPNKYEVLLSEFPSL